jgi:hypothetical protein
LARHVWHAWKAVERAVLPDAKLASSGAPAIRPRTQARWSARLASSARVLVVLLAMSGGAALETVSKRVGLDGTRRDVVVAYAAEANPESVSKNRRGCALSRKDCRRGSTAGEWNVRCGA